MTFNKACLFSQKPSNGACSFTFLDTEKLGIRAIVAKTISVFTEHISKFNVTVIMRTVLKKMESKSSLI